MSFLSETLGKDELAQPKQAASSMFPTAKGSFLTGIASESDTPAPIADMGHPALRDFQSAQQVAQRNAEHANSLSGILSNTVSELAAPFVAGYKAAAGQVQPKSLNPLQAGTDAAHAVEDSVVNAIKETGTKLSAAKTVLMDAHSTLLQKGASSGEAALSVLNPIFAVATAPLTYATRLPGIGLVADKVNEIFSALGSGAGTYATTALVDDLPVSQETKDTIRPLVHDTAALIAQLAAGKLGGEGIGMIADHTKSILHTVADDVKANPPEVAPPQFKAAPIEGTLPDRLAATDERKLPVFGDTSLRKLPVQDQSEFQQIPNADRYTPDEELPTIDFGKPARSTLPTIDIGTRAPKGPAAGFTYEPIKAPVESTVPPPRGTPASPFLKTIFNPEAAPTASVVETPPPLLSVAAKEQGTLAPIGEGERVPSRLAANVEANAIEKKLTNSLGDLPEYNRVNLKEQAQHAADLISDDPARALRIALGKEVPPNHILPEAVFTAVEDRAVKSGDVLTLRRLAQESTLSTEATAMGQRIRALGERDQDSPVKIIQDIQKARTELVQKKLGKPVKAAKAAEVKEIKDSIRETAKASRQTWEEFTHSLTCNI